MTNKSINITFFNHEKFKLFSLYKIRKCFKKNLNTRRNYYLYTKDCNVIFDLKKYSSLQILNIDECDCLLDIIEIINNVNRKHKIVCFSSTAVSKETFKLLEDNLKASISIKGYHKFK